MIEPGLGRGGGEAGILAQARVRVHVDHVGDPIRGQAQIDARISGEAERLPARQRQRLQPSRQVGCHRKAASGALIARIGLVPFGRVVLDARQVGGPVQKLELRRRQGSDAAGPVGQQRDVELPAVDIRLRVPARRERRGRCGVHRVRPEPGRGMGDRRFHDERAGQTVFGRGGDGDAGRAQEAAHGALVGGQRQRGQVRPRIPQPQPLQQRRHGDRQHVGTAQALHEIEHQIRRGCAQPGLARREVRRHGEPGHPPARRREPARDGRCGNQHVLLIERRLRRHRLVQHHAVPHQRSPTRAQASSITRSSSQA